LYAQLLRNLPVVIPAECTGNTPVYHLYVISAPRRDELQDYLKTQGISTGIHYPIPVHLQAAMDFLGYKSGDLPVTELAVSQILSLPMFAELADEEIANISDCIKSFYSGGR
jgi:dTDP-4-amino-4,6-dideoxygalactose transaminase